MRYRKEVEGQEELMVALTYNPDRRTLSIVIVREGLEEYFTQVKIETPPKGFENWEEIPDLKPY